MLFVSQNWAFQKRLPTKRPKQIEKKRLAGTMSSPSLSPASKLLSGSVSTSILGEAAGNKLLEVNLNVQGKTFVALIDSGATHNFISLQVLNNL